MKFKSTKNWLKAAGIELENKDKKYEKDQKDMIDSFSWASCPLVIDYDPEHLELQNNCIWNNPEFKALKKGETEVTVLEFYLSLAKRYVSAKGVIYTVEID